MGDDTNEITRNSAKRKQRRVTKRRSQCTQGLKKVTKMTANWAKTQDTQRTGWRHWFLITTKSGKNNWSKLKLTRHRATPPIRREISTTDKIPRTHNYGDTVNKGNYFANMWTAIVCTEIESLLRRLPTKKWTWPALHWDNYSRWRHQ